MSPSGSIPVPDSLVATSIGVADLVDRRRGSNAARQLLLCAAVMGVIAAIAVALALTIASPERLSRSTLFAGPYGWFNENSEDRVDERLQRAANSALGGRNGTVIVMDPQTGRIRAVVNSKVAFAESFRPGSTLKPLTALAALRSGIIDAGSESLCREKFAHAEFHTTCSHPRDLPPLNPTEAIAYSCNYYFGKVGERMAEASLKATLDDFGFGKQTGVKLNAEASGKLMPAAWRPHSAMGEGDYLQTTPIQLINAYATLVNGGHRFTPRTARAAGFVANLQADIAIDENHRALILRGLRGAVRYGTAESAGLYSLPIYTFGKTGTATEINGFRMQGWFVGFATALNDGPNAQGESSALAPDQTKLAVLVFLSRGHGAEAAEVARPIFAEYARNVETRRTGNMAVRDFNSAHPRVPASQSPGAIATSAVRVHLVSENITRSMSLEDYVRGVVATEGSVENELEALKALAVASRTYAVKNIHRHARDGYDFCSTTHCQRYRNAASEDVPTVVVEAVEKTAGEVLLGSDAQVADSYFSASCGGATANLGALWGGSAPPHLRGVRDDYCVSEPHANWTDTISESDLLKALKTDPRTNVGDRLGSVSVRRTDASGRAELIEIEGDRRITIDGWDFKIIVGRALGWNLLKSSRFTVARVGSNFVFRGSGFGHGLGLCQEGAHVMAGRGASHRQILAKYFPGTNVTQTVSLRTSPASQPTTFADLIWKDAGRFEFPISDFRFVRAAARRTLASENFRINYPVTLDQRDVASLLPVLESSRRSLLGRVAAAGVGAQFPALDVFINETTGDFVGRTRQPPWAAAATHKSQIELQPLATLKRRRILETTLRHELVHTIVDVLGRGRTPRWLSEGMALHFADEGRLIARYEPRKRMTIEEIEAKLTGTRSANEMKAAYAAAYREVKNLISREGETSVWRLAAR